MGVGGCIVGTCQAVQREGYRTRGEGGALFSCSNQNPRRMFSFIDQDWSSIRNSFLNDGL